METFGLILMLLSVFAVFVGVVSLVVLIVMAISKKRLKVPGIVTGASFGLALLFFVSFIILVVVAPYEEPIASKDNLPRSSADANSSDEEEVEIPQRKTETDSDKEEEVAESNVEEDDEEESEFEESLKDNREEREKEEEEENTDLATEDVDDEVVDEVSEEIEESAPEVDPEDLSNYRTDYDIKDVERNPAEYKDELLSFQGKIIQVMEDDVYTAYRIAINDDYDRIAYVQTFSLTLEERLLEDDYVTVYGIFNDLLTYETVLGANQTVPAFMAHGKRIILN